MLAQIVQHALSSKYNLTLVTAEKARRLRITLAYSFYLQTVCCPTEQSLKQHTIFFCAQGFR